VAVGGAGVGGIGLASYDIGAHQAVSTATSVTQTQAATATASAQDGYQLSQVLTQAVLATATAAGADVFVTQSVLATATATYGFLPGLDEFVTVGTWSSPVTLEAGDQYILTLTGTNSAINPRCSITLQLEDQ
jgi:hypothetical protein